MVDKLTDFIIRPTQRRYNPKADLGPSLFTIDHKYYGSRMDFEVKNRRNKTLKCSLFHHNIHQNERHPLMVYCHGNSGNRTYSYEIVYRMLKNRISVLTFDFAGCGNSEGNYVFLGLFEQFDIEDVLNYTLNRFNFIDTNKIGIWGRSMGAVSTLLYASRNSSISVIILDSPFKDLSELLKEYINKFKLISVLIGDYLYNKLRRRALKKAGFDFEDLKPVECINSCRVPAYFFHATRDKIVPMHHSKALYDAYPAEKQYSEVKGGHNSKRPPEIYDKISDYVLSVFGRGDVVKDEVRGARQKKDKDYYYGNNTGDTNARLETNQEFGYEKTEFAESSKNYEETLDMKEIGDRMIGDNDTSSSDLDIKLNGLDLTDLTTCR